MGYEFKGREELVWAVLVAAGTVALEALAAFDPAVVTDYRAWAVGVGAAVIRAAAGATLAWLGGLRHKD